MMSSYLRGLAVCLMVAVVTAYPDCTPLHNRALRGMMAILPDEYSLVGKEFVTNLIPGLEFSNPKFEQLNYLIGEDVACFAPGKLIHEYRSPVPVKLTLPWTTTCAGKSGVIAAHLTGVTFKIAVDVKASGNFTHVTVMNVYDFVTDRVSLTMDGLEFFAKVLGTVFGKRFVDDLKPWLEGLLETVYKEIISQAASNFTLQE